MNHDASLPANIEWLLDADPSIRWQVMRDLTDTPPAVVAQERARIAAEGWGARVLDQQRPDGQWGDGVAVPFWWSNMYTLVWLRDLGLDPSSERARIAIDSVREHVTWGAEFGHSPFFDGEVEPCINGHALTIRRTLYSTARAVTVTARRRVGPARSRWRCSRPRSRSS